MTFFLEAFSSLVTELKGGMSSAELRAIGEEVVSENALEGKTLPSGRKMTPYPAWASEVPTYNASPFVKMRTAGPTVSWCATNEAREPWSRLS